MNDAAVAEINEMLHGELRSTSVVGAYGVDSPATHGSGHNDDGNGVSELLDVLLPEEWPHEDECLAAVLEQGKNGLRLHARRSHRAERQVVVSVLRGPVELLDQFTVELVVESEDDSNRATARPTEEPSSLIEPVPTARLPHASRVLA